jgi:alkanesulfonate monooxygenase SsuD/methylene tetrahydromethanopterin reductase-like flavin-dependent oxidoreductase (luciferase family)
MTVDVGVVIRPQSPPETMPGLFRQAEAGGLSQVWLWEDCFLEGGIASAATALARTERLGVGLGLLPVPLRNVAATAMEIATLDRMHGDRFRVTVGHGVQEWMAQVGARSASPLTHMREYLTALRALLAGEVVSMDGEYVRLHEVALDWPPPRPTRILMGAAGPKSLSLAGEAADGVVIMEDTSPEALAVALESVRQGRERAARQDPFDVVVYLRAYRGPDAQSKLLRDGKHPTGNFGVELYAAAVSQAGADLAGAGATTVALVPAGDDPSASEYLDAAMEIVNGLPAAVRTADERPVSSG